MRLPYFASRLAGPVTVRRRRLLPSEVVLHVTSNGQHCYCQVVRAKVGRQWHVAFLNVAGSTGHPTGCIEGLASAEFRKLGVPSTALVVWDVDRFEWNDETHIHRVTFSGFGRRQFFGPRWISEIPPPVLRAAIEHAQAEIFSPWTVGRMGAHG